MPFVDARALGQEAQLQTDVCVVGAGAAGLTIAAELSRHGLEVVLVESGGFEPDEEVQRLHDLESTGYPVRENFMSRARYFGGTCNLWAGRSMLLNPIDFERRDWVPGSGWPIPMDEVARYYPRAFSVLELPRLGLEGIESVESMTSAEERAIFAAATFAPTVSLWPKSATRFGSLFGPELRKADNARVLLHASTVEIGLNDAGNAVDSIVAATLEGGRIRVKARRVVLACGGLENARLLLASRRKHAHGIGNGHDCVGRYFMDHPRAVFGKVHLRAGVKTPMLRGRPLRDGKVQLGIGMSPETQRREGLLNHYLTLEAQTSGYTQAKYQSFIQTMKVVLRRGYAGSRWGFARANLNKIPEMIYLLSPKELMPHWLYRWYVGLREAVPRKAVPKSFVVVYFCEQPPNRSSRISLSEERDRLGVNRLKLNWVISEDVRRSVFRMQDLLGETLDRSGAGTLEPAGEELAFTDASHHMGTTRMSSTPRDGVVDINCQVHGVANLFLAGSSVFPSAGHANPTLTIVALALRLADHLRLARRGMVDLK